mmetsp:Transcript_40680/g.88728  ORF Transcript_40680/g.88728 Transcript_40680/m.88728 type:complete len:221 (+) Transcript_40680:85-747(+)
MPLSERQMTRYAGTYRLVAKAPWETLKAADFGRPDWGAMYALKPNGQPNGLLTPRQACKLFSDACFMLDKTEENPRFLLEKMPDCTRKFYKKKQWRSQLLEAARRVTMRLSKGMGISTNCPGEDMFVHILVTSAFELGWNRCRDQWEALEECDKDRDLNRIVRACAHEEMASLFRVEGVAPGVNFKEWFKANDTSDKVMHNHELEGFVGEHEEDHGEDDQ